MFEGVGSGGTYGRWSMEASDSTKPTQYFTLVADGTLDLRTVVNATSNTSRRSTRSRPTRSEAGWTSTASRRFTSSAIDRGRRIQLPANVPSSGRGSGHEAPATVCLRRCRYPRLLPWRIFQRHDWVRCDGALVLPMLPSEGRQVGLSRLTSGCLYSYLQNPWRPGMCYWVHRNDSPCW